MATVNEFGITPTTLAEYKVFLESVWQTAFGADFNVDPDTSQGQLIGELALALSQADDALVLTAGALDIFAANGIQLQGLCSILSIKKRDATATVVTANMTGVPATLIPEGTRARSVNGDIFATNEDLTLSGGGTGSVTMTAAETGAIAVDIGELTQIVDVVPGWETVTNAAEGDLGLAAETNSEYRKRYFNTLFKNAISMLDAVTAAVYEVANVTEVLGRENDTTAPITEKNVVKPAHSIVIIVDGGTDEEIKDAIRLKKTGGTGTSGTTSVPDPPNENINFYYVTEVPVLIEVDITIGTNFPDNGLVLMKQRIYNYIAGTFAGSISDEYFETDGMTTSEDLDRNRLWTPVNSIPGHTTNSIVLKLKPGGSDTPLITVDLNEKVVIEDIDDISISVT